MAAALRGKVPATELYITIVGNSLTIVELSITIRRGAAPHTAGEGRSSDRAGGGPEARGEMSMDAGEGRMESGEAPPQWGRRAGERVRAWDVGDEVGRIGEEARSTRDEGPTRRGATSSEAGEYP